MKEAIPRSQSAFLFSRFSRQCTAGAARKTRSSQAGRWLASEAGSSAMAAPTGAGQRPESPVQTLGSGALCEGKQR